MVLATAAWCDAATRTWRGAGLDALWSNPANWEAGLVPADGDDVVFPVTSGPALSTNDLPDLLIGSLRIGSIRTVTGSGIRLKDGVNLSATGSIVLDLPIQLAASQSWTVVLATSLTTTSKGTVDLNGSTLTMNAVAGSGATSNGSINGTGGLVKVGSGTWTLAGTNTFQGPAAIVAGEILAQSISALGVGDGTAANGTTVVAGGRLQLWSGVYPPEAITIGGELWSRTGSLVRLTGPMTLTDHAQFVASGDLQIDAVITGFGNLAVSGSPILLGSTNTYAGTTQVRDHYLTPNGWAHLIVAADEAVPHAPALDLSESAQLTIRHHHQTLAGVTGTSRVQLESTASPAERGTLILNGAGEYLFSGVILGDGLIRKMGSGRQTFAGTSTGAIGSTIVEHGALAIQGTHAMAIDVGAAGRLELTGKTGAVTVASGGDLVLGFGSIPNEASALSLTDANLVVPGKASSAGPALATLTVVGPVTLGDSALALNLPFDFGALAATEVVLVNKVQAGPILGTFSGLPEGAEITTGAFAFRVTYVGGDGNDIVLTTTQARRTYLLAEGATGTFFTTDVLIANPHDTPVPARVEFLPVGAAPVSVDITMDPLSRKTIRIDEIPGLAGAELSTEVHSLSGRPLLVERTMSWDRSGYGAHTEHASEGLSTTWYFAEGSQGFFQTYLLLANPHDVDNAATVQYLRTNEPPVDRTYALTARSRLTVDISQDAALVNRSFGMVVTFTRPGLAERAMYFGAMPLFTGGHASAGVPAPSKTWFLPEGATGSFFETFILLANPNATPTSATLDFLGPEGESVFVNVEIPAKGRTTVNIEQQDPSLASTAVATRVLAGNPIVVERAQYWPDPPGTWSEAHNSFGVSELATRWGFAEGRVGLDRAYQTYILLANPDNLASTVTITFLREGRPPLTRDFFLAPKSRLNLSVGPGTAVPELQDETFGALIVSSLPIAVERAMYSNAVGQVWAAGTSATAVRVP
jgi:autotransporter-associated beta strand protein